MNDFLVGGVDMATKDSQDILSADDFPELGHVVCNEVVQPTTPDRNELVVHDQNRGQIQFQGASKKIQHFRVRSRFCMGTPIQTDKLNPFVNESDFHQGYGLAFRKQAPEKIVPVIVVAGQQVHGEILKSFRRNEYGARHFRGGIPRVQHL